MIDISPSPTFFFLIVAGFTAGFVDAVAGGGGLISLPALLALGLPPKLALGTNKAIGICTAMASSSRYWMSGVIEWRSVLPLAILAGLVAVGGALSATLLDPEILRPIILFGLIAVGIYTVTRRRFGLDERKIKGVRTGWMLMVVAAIGFYDGFFGPGTGTFLTMAFVLLLGKPLLPASANSRLINLGTNIGAIALFASRGYVDFAFALPASISAFIGGLCGASWAVRKGSRAIRPVFIGVTWLLIAKVAWDLWKSSG